VQFMKEQLTFTGDALGHGPSPSSNDP
jgi:hypothetical protein